jgi:hypothetical protein
MCKVFLANFSSVGAGFGGFAEARGLTGFGAVVSGEGGLEKYVFQATAKCGVNV